MERDLAAIRARRAERERAAGAAKVRQVSPEADNPPVEIGGGSSPPKPSTVVDPIGEDQDTIMSEAPKPDSDEPANHEAEGSFELSAEQAMISDVQEAPIETKLTPTENDTILPLSSIAQAVATETGLKPGLDSNGPSTAIQIPTTAELEDADFESMFNDVEGAHADNDINFDLEFSNDANMGEDLINGSAFGDITNTNSALLDLNAASNEDINTLLPGLENYVHDGEDFTMLDIPPATTLPQSAALPQTTKAGNSNTADTVADAAPVESNFDDMFFGSGYSTMGGAEHGDIAEDGVGDFGDFDETWFTTDEK